MQLTDWLFSDRPSLRPFISFHFISFLQGKIVDSLILANHYRDSSVFSAFASVLMIEGVKPTTLNSIIEGGSSEASDEHYFAAEAPLHSTGSSSSAHTNTHRKKGVRINSVNTHLSDPLVSTDSSGVQKIGPSGSSTDSFFVFGKRRQSSTHASTGACVRCSMGVKEAATSFWKWLGSLRSVNWHILFVKLKVILARSWRVLLRREKLMAGSTLVVVYFAVMFGAMLGKSTDDALAVASMFGMGNLVIILSNLPLIFFMFHNHQVASTHYLPACVAHLLRLVANLCAALVLSP
jgi:hypothetical protein